MNPKNSPVIASTEEPLLGQLNRLHSELKSLYEAKKAAEDECMNLRSQLTKAQTTILNQDEELGQWERGERRPFTQSEVAQRANRLKAEATTTFRVNRKNSRRMKRNRKQKTTTTNHEAIKRLGLQPLALSEPPIFSHN